ncbi:MAG: hypothetical protein ACREGG_03050, partial [Candidatus Saccharimonadales bacterium]
FEWELIAATPETQTWSDFKNRSVVLRPIAVTSIDEVFIIAHFNENLFNQYSYGVLLQKPPYFFIEKEARQHIEEYGQLRWSKFQGRLFQNRLEFGEAIIASKALNIEAGEA